MTQQHTPTLEPLTPGLYYLDTIECAKINAHDDLVAALKTILADREMRFSLEGREIDAQCRQARAALAKAKASA